MPPVDSFSARSVNVPGNVQACELTAKSGELATTKTTHATTVVVVIWACVSLPEAFSSPTIIALSNGSPEASAPRYTVRIAAQEFVRPVPVTVCPWWSPVARAQ